MKPIHRRYLTTVSVVWATCFVLLLLVYFIVLGPQSRAKTRLAKDLANKQQSCQEALKASQPQTKAQLSQQVEQLKQRVADFAIDLKDSANLTFDVSRLANEHKIESFSIKSQNTSAYAPAADAPQPRFIQEQHVEITFDADFNQFASFLNALERHRPVLFVEKFNVTQPAGGHTVSADQSPSAGPKPQVTMDLVFLVKKQHDT